ncbi:hypothetical protein BDZ45DRAFT_747779 [Acephala macrosclerotiorum]|nr:hypothetical protein BDZ45DRAFT_747779 [Acephala macrosclerotiorum]
MRSSSKSASPEVLKEWDLVHDVSKQDDRPNIQVVICSCSSHVSPRDIHILQASTPHTIITLPSPPQVRTLLANYMPLPATFLSPRSTKVFQNINDLHSQFQDSNIPSRAMKYVRNPFRLIRLADRGRVHAQRILSVRFLFNLTCVILWVLIRKFLEIFGIRINAFAMVGDCQNPGL